VLVSIVLLNWNGEKYIENCLESIIRQSYKKIELIVVDNASTDNSIAIINKFLGSITKYIGNIKNEGFASGMNIGIDNSLGQIIIPLNLDVVLTEDFVTNAVERFNNRSAVGVLGGKELAWRNGILTNEIVSQGGFFLKRRIQGITNLKKKSSYSFGVHGSFPCIRRNALKQSKEIWGYYYDPKFQTGWEDMDLWYRLRILGWKCYYDDSITAWHVGSASDNGNKRLIEKNLDYQKRIFRNRWYFIIKNITGSTLLCLLPAIILADILLVPYFLAKSPRSIRALIKAMFEVFINLKFILKDRNIAKNQVRIRKSDFQSCFFGF